jgi:hypothetical protein
VSRSGRSHELHTWPSKDAANSMRFGPWPCATSLASTKASADLPHTNRFEMVSGFVRFPSSPIVRAREGFSVSVDSCVSLVWFQRLKAIKPSRCHIVPNGRGVREAVCCAGQMGSGGGKLWMGRRARASDIVRSSHWFTKLHWYWQVGWRC